MKIVRFEVTVRIHDKPDMTEAQAILKARYGLMDVSGTIEAVQIGAPVDYAEHERRPEIAAL